MPTWVSLFEILADIYMALKFAPCKVLMYLPDRSMAAYKSAERFMPIARSIPDVYALITGGAAAEGNKLTRTMPALGSGLLFLWTRGREGGVSESFPGDVLSLDETQGMTLEQIDRVSERLSASRIKFRLMLSTPLWPEMDINAWWRAGDQRKFHSACGCSDGVVLTDVFHAAALTNSGKIPVVYNDRRFPGAPEDFVYYCPECGCYIPDPQEGEWRGRVEDGRSGLGHPASPCFPSPLIKPDVPISGIRLSDWLHRKAHDEVRVHSRMSGGRRLRLAAELLPTAPGTSGVCRLSPITMPSPSSEAHQKSASFPPPTLPGLSSTMTLSESR